MKTRFEKQTTTISRERNASGIIARTVNSLLLLGLTRGCRV
ncbi:hypothetical protein [Rhizobium sp. L1K21]|nr:hypothetical protein [Rhizobium sp. L1K21]